MNDPPLFHLTQGRAPLLVSFPHSGTYLPPALAARMTDAGRGVPDTDWHVPRLYDFLGDLGATWIAATHSRYAADLNRPPDDTALYPGQKKTGLVPIEAFGGEALYRAGETPSAEEIAIRRAAYWQPYHDAIQTELMRLHARHGVVLLWDAHSIRSEEPLLFDGQLPDLNLGTNDGASCAEAIAEAAFAAARNSTFSAVRDQRFKGGYITRHYGRPRAGVHAIQLEMAQAIYMREGPPYTFLDGPAVRVSAAIETMMRAALAVLPR